MNSLIYNIKYGLLKNGRHFFTKSKKKLKQIHLELDSVSVEANPFIPFLDVFF